MYMHGGVGRVGDGTVTAQHGQAWKALVCLIGWVSGDLILPHTLRHKVSNAVVFVHSGT